MTKISSLILKALYNAGNLVKSFEWWWVIFASKLLFCFGPNNKLKLPIAVVAGLIRGVQVG